MISKTVSSILTCLCNCLITRVFVYYVPSAGLQLSDAEITGLYHHAGPGLSMLFLVLEPAVIHCIKLKMINKQYFGKLILLLECFPS